MRSRSLRSDHIGAKASEGTRLLWAVLKREGWSQNKLALELGADSGKVNRWLHGILRPSLDWANELQKRFEIPQTAWGETPRRPIVLRTGTDG